MLNDIYKWRYLHNNIVICYNAMTLMSKGIGVKHLLSFETVTEECRHNKIGLSVFH